MGVGRTRVSGDGQNRNTRPVLRQKARNIWSRGRAKVLGGQEMKDLKKVTSKKRWLGSKGGSEGAKDL